MSSATSTSSPNLLSTHVEILHRHFKSYYHNLDLAASTDVPQILFPTFHRWPIELPFLWLGDLHLYLLINLLRSFLLQHDSSLDEHEENPEDIEIETEEDEIEEEEIEVGESCEFSKKIHQRDCRQKQQTTIRSLKHTFS